MRAERAPGRNGDAAEAKEGCDQNAANSNHPAHATEGKSARTDRQPDGRSVETTTTEAGSYFWAMAAKRKLAAMPIQLGGRRPSRSEGRRPGGVYRREAIVTF